MANTTQDGTTVCNFTVAVNRRGKQQDHPEADFFRVAAWRQLGDACAKYLSKGKKVAVVGSVSVSTYTGNDGVTRAQLDVLAQDVEFLTPKGEAGEGGDAAQGGYSPAAFLPTSPAVPNMASAPMPIETDELPF